MGNIFYSLLGFVIAIGLLTAIHEYGHFWAARRLGVKVLRFSIGFGKKLWSRSDKSGTEYAICAVPLGGYVKMLDENEAPVNSEERHAAYNNKPVWIRMLIIAAGPISNLIFAVLAYTFVFMWGISSIVPVIGEVPKDTIAYNAGLRSGQEIIAIDGRPTPTWEDIVVSLISHAGDNDFVEIDVRDIKAQTTSHHSLNLDKWNLDEGKQHFLFNLGLMPFDPLQPIIGKVLPGYPAEKAGLKEGDKITRLNGVKVQNITQTLKFIEDKFGKPVRMEILRDNKTISFSITPDKKVNDNGIETGFIGIQFAKQAYPDELIRVQRFGPIDAVIMAWERTKEYSILTLQFIGKMIMGKMSLEHMSGPVGIAQYAGATVQSGIETFMGFLALVSISLGVLNMLPIPVLDGGHFLFCIIEIIRGKALSTRATNVGMMIGFVILGSVMVLALYNDISRLIQ